MGTGARVSSIRSLPGGISSAVHALSVDRRGRRERVVLRQFVDEGWLAREPDLATHEGAVLRTLARHELPTPRLIAVDENGVEAGVPSVLMAALKGLPVLAPSDTAAWLEQMAHMLPRIHGIRPTSRELQWRYHQYYDPATLRVPDWSHCPDAWAGAIAVARGPRPPAEEHLIHRDYHPANVLWQDDQITGIVDWVNACRGPAGVDIGHCRRNLALLHGVDVADRFLDECLRWAEYDPYWDIVTLLDALPDNEPYAGWSALGVEIGQDAVRERADVYVASLVARL